jgi:sterol 3beta-glucosyltransferase
MPLDPTKDMPHPFVTQARLPRFLNHVTHKLFDKLFWATYEPTLNPFRTELGLAPRKNTATFNPPVPGAPVIELFSAQVVPSRSDLPPHVFTAGYQRLPSSVRARLGESAPPTGLEQWLAKGEKPIYLGFGSMPVRDPVAHTQMALNVAKELGARVIIAAGWTDLSAVHDQQSEQAFFIKTVDHGWMFPQCAAAVHHGGAGTTAASLEAGVPTVICSVFADQPHWGSRVERLGVGAHVPYAKLNQARLTKALRVALQEETKARAVALGEKLRAEEGNAVALQELLKHLQGIARAA